MTSLRTKLALALVVALAAGCGDDPDHPPMPDGGPPDGSAPDGSPGDTMGSSDTAPVTQSFVILHTNDLHSHLMGFGPEADYSPATPGDDGTTGGLARLAAQIAAARSAAGTTPVLLLDSGDFTMGTPFHMLGLTASAELTEMGKLKYDAITLGNHEFDWGPKALAGIVGAAVKNGFSVPIVATNMNFSAMDPGDDDLEKLLMSNVLRRKFIKDVGGIKVGIFGLMGKDADTVSPLKKPVTIADIAVASRAAVKELRETDKVDVVIALSHSGTDAMGMGEDRALA
ncbi:MAG TPA: metallophosphoesterase, partial [Polyangia bacterium]|nr:metallophosphoesterase [Polyangia bacterium]